MNRINAFDQFVREDFSKRLSSEGDLNVWMLKEVISGNPDGLKAWKIVIRLLGNKMRVPEGTNLLNSLLAIVEKGFKSDAAGVRSETFVAWRTLIDNFAAEPAVLLQNKRIKLIIRPLVVSDERC